MSAKISRARRRELERAAKAIRVRGQLAGWPVERLAGEIMERLAEVSPLEAHRFAHGWTREELSRVLDRLHERDGLRPLRIASSEICGWEHGRHQPSPDRQEYLCRAYRTRPDRLGFGRDHSARRSEPAVPAPTRMGLSRPADALEEQDTDRRQAMKAGGAALVVTIAGALGLDIERLGAVLSGDHRADHMALEAVAGLVGELDRESYTAPPAALLPVVQGQLAALRRLSTGGSLQGRRCQVAGQAAEIAGWLSYEVDDRRAARAYYGEAEALAAEAADRALRARTLAARSVLCSNLSQGRRGASGVAVALLDEADRAAGPGTPGWLRAWILGLRGLEHAAAGAGTASGRDLEAAGEALKTDPEGAPALFGEGWLAGYRGTALMLLGEARAAEALLESRMTGTEPSFVASRTATMIDLATVYADQGEPDRGCALLGEVLSSLAGSGLTSRIQRTVGARQQFEPYRDTPAVRLLDEQIRAAVRG